MRREGWSWASANTLDRGLYVLSRDGVEVGTVSLLPEVEWHSVRLAFVCEAFDKIDRIPAPEV